MFVVGLVCWILLVVASVLVVRRFGVSAGLSVAIGPLLLNLVLVIGAETLSAARAYSLGGLRALGLTLSLGALVYLGAVGVVTHRRGRADNTKTVWQRLSTAPLSAKLAGLGLALVGLTTLVTGLATLPNNIDSLTYHLPRIMQWLQLGRVAAFETPYPAQVYLPPGSEHVNAVLIALSGTDHLAFLVQWTAWVSLVASVVVMCRSLGVSWGPALVSGLLAGSAPGVLGQAATTQNDLITAAYVCAAAAVLVVLRCRRVSAAVPPEGDHLAETPDLAALSSRQSWRDAASPRSGGVALLVLVIALLGGAICFKIPALLFGVPLCVWWVREVIAAKQTRSVLLWSVAAIALVSLINAPWMIRNQQQFGSLTGPDLGLTVSQGHVQVATANVLKNLGHEVGLPSIDAVNDRVRDVLVDVSEGISGLDADDKRSSFTPVGVRSERNEDRPSNLLQFVAFGMSAVTVLATKRLRRRGWPLVASAVAGYVIFCALVKYQLWGGRFMLPLIGLTAPLAGLALQRLEGKGREIASVILSVLCLLHCAPWLMA